jgi:hypothetical protein
MELRNISLSGVAISGSNSTPPPTNTCGPNANGTYPNETVTGTLTGNTVWGDNVYGYTDDSDFAAAVVHAGLATPGQTVTIKKISQGTKNNFPSTIANGITTTAYPNPWCAVIIELV